MSCFNWVTRYPQYPKLFETTMLPVVLGGDVKLVLSGSDSGYLFFWKDLKQLEDNCGGFLKGHVSQLSRIVTATNSS